MCANGYEIRGEIKIDMISLMDLVGMGEKDQTSSVTSNFQPIPVDQSPVWQTCHGADRNPLQRKLIIYRIKKGGCKTYGFCIRHNK